MPELPDIAIYIEALESRIAGKILRHTRLANPFLLRTAVPPIQSVEGKKVIELRRIGKRIAIGFEDDLWLVIHLMIAGRLHWAASGAKISEKYFSASFDFGDGALLLTEAGSKKRASLHVFAGRDSVKALDPGGLELLEANAKEFAGALTRQNHTLKRALTDPRLFSGIGNAYSDEILHGARLSPIAMTQKLSNNEIARLRKAARETLTKWTESLRRELNGAFPEKVTAFREGFAAHGKFGKPCPICGTPIQRIRYADNETNYCPQCQTGGRLLADRSLSRLLKKDWPKTLEELEEMRHNHELKNR